MANSSSKMAILFAMVNTILLVATVRLSGEDKLPVAVGNVTKVAKQFAEISLGSKNGARPGARGQTRQDSARSSQPSGNRPAFRSIAVARRRHVLRKGVHGSSNLKAVVELFLDASHQFGLPFFRHAVQFAGLCR